MRPTNVLSVNLQLSCAGYPERPSASDFYARLVETIPGVRSAASTAFLVLEQGWPVDTASSTARLPANPARSPSRNITR